MSFAEHQIWLELLATGNETGLAKVAAEAGFGEPGRTAANLCLLHETLADPRLIIALARHALTTADPDLALNNLERLSTRVDKSDLTIVLIDETSTRQLLTVLGASPFLTGILCRRASFFAGLFRKGQINQSKTEPQMYAELRQMIGDDADTAKMKEGLRTYKAEEMLRIGSRDLCGMAELEEVTAELTALAAATLQRAFEVCSRQLQKEYGSPLLDSTAEEPNREADFTILGMGKFGGCELNFSSDI
ncbi:MAG: bifunctional [glutamate--ammonia ligase]-adenylyl-L-tyrosine phosphorylase/[glutamate--ammonia-ligase] adenylyltransferase, partial [Desulfuromonadales bacterium]